MEVTYQVPTITKYVNELTPHPDNYNTHPKGQISQLAESLTTFGQFKNMVAWTCPENMTTPDGVELHEGVCYILAGHGLWLAAMEAGIDELEVKDYSGLSYEMALSLLMVDNAAPLGSEPIADKLAALLDRTRHLTADKPGLAGMLAALRERVGVNGNGKTPPEETLIVDKAEELQKKWKVKLGDIWQIADHFIICGDCREPETWQRLMNAAGVDKVNGVFTSPPYAEQRKAQYGGVPTGEYVQWWEAVQRNVRAALAGDGSFFVNIKPHCEDGQRVLYVFDLVLAMVRVWGWRFVDELYWKRQGYPGDYQYRLKNVIEPIYQFASQNQIKFYPESVLIGYSDNTTESAYRDKSKSGSGFLAATFFPNDASGARPGNMIYCPNGATATDTGTFQAAAFPVALPTFFLRAYSDPGDVWLDPFLGSGTTICAAHNENRIGLGVERLEKYISVCLERLATLTQQQPRLVSG